MQISCFLALLLWIHSEGLPNPPRKPQSNQPLLSSPAPPRAQRGHLLFPVLTREAQALRPFPRQAEGRERVCCFSLLVSLSLATDHQAADQEKRKREKERRKTTNFLWRSACSPGLECTPSTRQLRNPADALSDLGAPELHSCPPPPSSGDPSRGRESGSGHEQAGTAAHKPV